MHELSSPGEIPGKYRNVNPNFFYWSMKNKSLPITGNGTETRDWTYVTDIFEGLLAMGIVENAIGEAINLGSANDHQVKDMAEIVNKLTENNSGIKYTERRDWDTKKCLLSSIDKAHDILGYRPKMGFEEGLEKTYQWFVDNWENIDRNAEF